ncbi:hypothetical protein LQ757_18245 [Agromyces sp. SYSU K20354]|uniref:hypothetical protein n=1 Tax=Agromyces cavernae TaxID=2898659 RepID=UPI001E611A5F|nr:hypothetical protein [Agromyces cavernae]MCD2444227.1 hypothetical protein [Agromyces cavernae]
MSAGETGERMSQRERMTRPRTIPEARGLSGGSIRLTQQEADPIGAITASPIVAIGAILAFVGSIALTIAHWGEVSSTLAAVLAIVFVAGAGFVASRSASPARAPFTADRLWLVVSLAVGGAIAEYVSTIGANRYLYDDFGPLVIGMMILSVAPYCTWRSLVFAGLTASAVLSILVAGGSPTIATGAPPLALIVVGSAPVLAMTAAAASYSYTVVAATLAWHREANRAALEHDVALRSGFAQSGSPSRVSVLRREVLPFLAGVMTAERVSVADADRARELAEALRRALRAGIESTWLDALAASLSATNEVTIGIVDPMGAAVELREDQRSVLTALILWLGDAGRARSIRVSFTTGGDHGCIVVDADLGEQAPSKREIDRFVAVARAAALGAEGQVTHEHVRVQLTYQLGTSVE